MGSLDFHPREAGNEALRAGQVSEKPKKAARTFIPTASNVPPPTGSVGTMWGAGTPVLSAVMRSTQPNPAGLPSSLSRRKVESPALTDQYQRKQAKTTKI